MEKNIGKNHRSERGGAGVKLVLVLLVLFVVGHGLINYVPVAYNGASFQEEMQTAVVQGTALPNGNDPLGVIKARLKRVAVANDIPPNAFMEVKQVSNVVQARVAYSKQVDILPFGLYTYQYNFDHTATPAGFLAKQ
jgi:Flp pilus assembly protein TadG